MKRTQTEAINASKAIFRNAEPGKLIVVSGFSGFVTTCEENGRTEIYVFGSFDDEPEVSYAFDCRGNKLAVFDETETEDSKTEFQEWIEENYETTDNPYEALFILNDGTLLDGLFDYGIRGEDHHGMLGFLKGKNIPESQEWRTLHMEQGIVRLVPETEEALIGEGQILTDIQRNLISELGFSIEAYC